MDPQTKQFLAEAGCKGGRAKSDRKRLAGKANAAKAREAKLLYRLNPEKRPVVIKPYQGNNDIYVNTPLLQYLNDNKEKP